MSTAGGRFDFDDGGTYSGGWEDGKANGFGICSGPKNQGQFAGAWHLGFETSGVYMWASGNNFKGQWMQGKRHGVGVEVKGRWIYQGEWMQGFKGRYGIRYSTSTGAKYEGTWTTGLQDGYGVETYADGGIYQGQWLRGIRHGYGVRQSVPYGLAAHHQQKTGRESLTSLRSEQEADFVVKDRDRKLDEKRGGFVLSATKNEDIIALPLKRRPESSTGDGRSSSRTTGLRKTIFEGLKLRKQKSTGDIQDPVPGHRLQGMTGGGSGGSVRSTISNISQASYGSLQSTMTGVSLHTDSNTSFISQDDITDLNMIETYMGEWKNDKRAGFGVSERSDGLKYEGEWDGNKRHGYGSTTFRDGTKEEGKYKNNVLISSGKKSKLFLMRANKLRDRIQNAVSAARSASQIALQKSDISVSRMATARAKAELALVAVSKAESDAETARVKAAEYAPDLFQPHADKSEAVSTRSPLLSFGDHYDISVTSRPRPDTRTPLPAAVAAKSLLMRMANIAGVDRGHETRKPPPSIASALVSVAMDSSAALMKNRPGGSGLGGGLAMGLGGLAVGIGAGFGGGVGGAQAGDTTDQSQQHSPPLTAVSEPRTGGISGAETKVAEPSNSNGLSAEGVQAPIQLNPRPLIDDHFDQYQTLSRPSTLTGQGAAATAAGRHSRPRNPFSPSTSDGDHPAASGQGGYDSRMTNPSTIHHHRNEPTADTSRPPSSMSRRQTLTAWGPTPAQATTRYEGPSSSSTRRANENGGLNYEAKVTATQSFFRAPPPQRGGSSSFGLRRATGNLGSLPDVDEVKAGSVRGQSSMPREEVHLMSLRRREEIRIQREEEARRRQQEIVLSFSEFKEWCRQRQLMVLVLAVNISLATMFFNLLSY